MDELLIPLRVPAGWTVVTNMFYNLIPVVTQGEFVNRHLFSDDMLIIEQMRMPGLSDPRFILDLSWGPPGDPSGHYRLTLMHGDWDHVVCTVESRNSLDARKLIDHWLDVASQCMSLEEARLHLLGNPDHKKGSSILRKAVERIMIPLREAAGT
jgi:hypothetical protein